MAPVAGLVGFAVPEMEGVPDTFFPEGVADVSVVLEKDVFFANDENDLHDLELGDNGWVVQVGDEQSRHIEIDILVAVAVEEVVKKLQGGGEVIAAAEADHLVEQVGMFKCQVGG